MSFWDIFKTVKKPKKKEREKWAKQAEQAKKNTKANAKTSRKSASPKPHKTTSSSTSSSKPSSKPSYSSSRRGGYVSTNVQKRARKQSDNTLKAHSAYTARLKKEREAESRKAVKALQKYTGHKYKNNEAINATYTGDPEGYKKYSLAAKAQDKTADKTVYDAKTKQAKGQTIKEYYHAPEHKEEAKKARKEVQNLIDNHTTLAGVADAYGSTVGRGIDDMKDVFKDIKGVKPLNTKKYDKSTSAKVAKMAGIASQYVTPGGIANKIVGKTAIKTATSAAVKATAKAGTKATIKGVAKATGKKLTKETAKKTLQKTAKEVVEETAKKSGKKITKESVKNFAKKRAAEVIADTPLDVIHAKHDSKGDTSEFWNQMWLNAGLNVVAGAGTEYIGKTLKAVKAKSALKKASRKETAKAVKKTLDVLDKRAKDQGDYLSDLRTKMGVKGKPTAKVSKGKPVKQVILKDKKTGKVLAKGTPKTKLEKQTMIKAAMRKAGGIDNVKAETGWENTKPLTKGEADKIPTRPLKDSEIEEGARGVEKELDNTPVNGTADYNKGLKSYKKSKVRKEKVKDLLPSNHELNGNTKEISKTIDDDVSEIIARRNAGDMQGAESLENDLAHRLADEDKQIYDKSLDTGDFQTFKEYVSNKPFYPPEGMTVKEAQEMFGSRNPEAKGVIKFVKRNGKRKGREIDVLAEELDGMFPGVLKDKGNTEDILGDIREYLEGGHKKDFSFMGELSGKELDDLVDMKRADIQSAIEDIENDIKTLQKNKDRMSPRKFEEQKSILEAERKEVKAREDAEAQKIQDKKDAKRIENKKTTQRTVEEIQADLNAKESAPVANIRNDMGRSARGVDFRPAVKAREKIVDAGAAIEDIARIMMKSSDPDTQKLGKDLYGAINAVRQSRSQAQFHLHATSKARKELESVVEEYLGTKSLGKSASEITTPLHKLEKKMKKQGLDIWEDFQTYVYHMHNPARSKQGKGVFGEGINGITSINTIKELEKKYKDAGQTKAWEAIVQAQKDTVEYFKKLQDMSVKAGLISPNTRSFLDEMYEQYVPTFRDKKSKQKAVTSNPYDNSAGVAKEKEAKGSSEDLLSIEQQMVDKTMNVYQRIANNNMIKKLAEAQGSNGDELIKAGMTPEEVLDKSMFAEKVGDQYTMKYFENGEMKAVPCSRDVHDAIKALNKSGINPANYGKFMEHALNGVSGATSIFKKLVTEWNPFFAMWRNPMKDFGDALMYSKDAFSFLYHMPFTAVHIAKRDKYWQLWKASGGTQSSLFENSKNLKISKNPIGAMNQFFEQFPRMTEFASVIDQQLIDAGFKAGDFKHLTKEMIDNASQAGADITVNFGRTGTTTRFLNKYGVPFLNPGIQGLSKATRALITERKGAKAWVGLAIKAAMLGWTPAVVQEIVYAKDKDYQMLNARDKANNICIKMDDGNFLKIPVGRLLADISAPARKITSDALGTNGYTWKDVFALIESNSAPADPFNDNLIAPLFRTGMNKTWYGGDIESQHEQDNKHPWDIYDANTSEISKYVAKTKVGKAIGWSPKKIDTLIKQYSGVVGETLLPLTTKKAEGGGLLSGAKTLGKKTYTLDPTYSNKLLGDFYDKYGEAKKGANDSEKSKKKFQAYKNQASRLDVINDAVKDVQGMNIGYDKKNKMIEDLQDYRNKVVLNFSKTEDYSKSAQYADMAAVNKIIGSKYAIEHYVNEKDQKDVKAYAKNHDLNDIINVNRNLSKYGFSTSRSDQTRIKALAIADSGKGNKDLYNYFNVDDSTRKLIKKYRNAGGTLEELGDVQKKMEKTAKAAGMTVGDLARGAMAFALAKAGGSNRLFQMYDESKPNSKEYWEHSVRSGRGMAATGLTLKDRQKAYDACKGDGGHCSKDDIVKYLNGTNYTQEQKSYLFWQLANWNTSENPYGEYTPKFKPKKSKTAGKVDWNKKKTLNEYTKAAKANADDEFWTRYRFAKQAEENAKTKKTGISAPHSDEDYIPKRALEVQDSYDKEGIEKIKEILGGYPKRMSKRLIEAAKKSPKIKDDSDTIYGDGKEGSSSGGGGRGYYRRYGRGGRGGRGGSSSSGGGLDFPELKTAKTTTPSDTSAKTPTIGTAKSKSVDWTPKMVSTKPGWTDAQIRKVFNALISQGLTREQAVSRIASLWNTRFG